MFTTIISGLIIAWILTLFNFDEICIEFFSNHFNIKFTLATYYMSFVMLGFISYLIGEI